MPKKSQSYEQMIDKLKGILEKMETGNTSLEESMKLYEEGIMLTNKLYMLLKDSEEKIKILKKDTIEDFEG
ncbi:exodeoxyribonuclease VII small subunit [Clostridium polynesiense]|uniref:exodeoxyribonuclease VII small subunit n=1 Tax=Clostridium polynesiense TaxID=1325933 RepID=UPI000590D893|nr:exodeoxyribonuclease VII small subunit [Clostridium polynesiense]